MQPTNSRAMQHKWRLALVFGWPLGLVELVIFAFSMAYVSRLFPPLQAVLIGLSLYIVIPAIAGYVSRIRNPGELRGATWAGVRIGVTSLVTFVLGAIIVFAILFIRYVAMTPGFDPHAPHRRGLYDPAWEFQILITGLGILLVLHCIGVLLSVVGSWLGGTLAFQRGAAQRQAQAGG